MHIKKMLCAIICSASVVSSPIMAQSLSPSARIAATTPVKRVAPAPKKESNLGGGSVIIYILAAAAVVAGIILLTDGDDEPTSP